MRVRYTQSVNPQKNMFSKQDVDSELGAVSNVAVVRQKIAVVENQQHMQKFKAAYDKCFEKFHGKLMEQYAFM